VLLCRLTSSGPLYGAIVGVGAVPKDLRKGGAHGANGGGLENHSMELGHPHTIPLTSLQWA